MENFICTTCGVQYEQSFSPPTVCRICNDERQYVNSEGQDWITLNQMKEESYSNVVTQQEENLYSIKTVPEVGIGQAAYLIQEQNFNLLWDCITYIDQSTVQTLKKLGGINAIALSHPHFYSTQVEWAETFDVPIYIHEYDKKWVTRASENIVYWSGETYELSDGLTLYRLGGHFKGGTVLHWNNGNNLKGVILSGDIIQVVQDSNWVSFMYSYPNLIPLPPFKVNEMVEKISHLRFSRLYNAFLGIVKENANDAVKKSAHRYIEAIKGNWFQT